MDGAPASETADSEAVTDGLARHASEIEIVVRGSVVVITGVVERVEQGYRIVKAIASLDGVTGVEDDLRPRVA